MYLAAECEEDSEDVRYYAVLSVKKSKNVGGNSNFNFNRSHSQLAFGGSGSRTFGGGRNDDSSAGLHNDSVVESENIIPIIFLHQYIIF